MTEKEFMTIRRATQQHRMTEELRQFMVESWQKDRQIILDLFAKKEEEKEEEEE